MLSAGPCLLTAVMTTSLLWAAALLLFCRVPALLQSQLSCAECFEVPLYCSLHTHLPEALHCKAMSTDVMTNVHCITNALSLHLLRSWSYERRW